MQDCMLKYPELYGEDDDPKEKEDDSIENSQEPSYPEDPSTEKSEDSSSKSWCPMLSVIYTVGPIYNYCDGVLWE